MKRILIIEDDTPVRENICEMLQMEGYAVHSASDGQEGIYKAVTEKYDLIICDIMMPVLDGIEVLAQIRKNPLTVSIPFVFLTAKAERDDQRIGMNQGADDYLTKPFTRLELLNTVKTRLERKLDLQHEAVISQSRINNTAMHLLPLEFSIPLRVIKNLADQLISIRKVDDIAEIIQIGQRLDHATRDLTRITQKYLLLGDLEKRLNEAVNIPETQGITNQADLIFGEVYQDIFKEFQGISSEMDLEPFNCMMDPENYFKFCELIMHDLVRDVDPTSSIKIQGRKVIVDEGYQLNIRYTSKNNLLTANQALFIDEANRTQEISINQRIAALLNCRFEISQLNNQVEIRIILPTK